MEPIKISVDVNVELSEQTKSFISQLFGNSCNCAKPAATAAPKAEASAAPSKSAVKATKAPEVEAPAAPAKPAVKATKAPEVEAPEVEAPAITIEEIRVVLSEKVTAHRDEIRQVLTSLGAKNVTTLDPSRYEEMYSFLVSLD